MPYDILANKRTTSVVIFANANTGNVIITGNSTVSNVAMGTEVLTGAAITQIIASAAPSGTAYWEVRRGANLVFVVDSTCGVVDFAGSGLSLSKDSAANISANLIGGGAGTITIEMQKIGPTTTYT